MEIKNILHKSIKKEYEANAYMMLVRDYINSQWYCSNYVWIGLPKKEKLKILFFFLTQPRQARVRHFIDSVQNISCPYKYIDK